MDNKSGCIIAAIIGIAVVALIGLVGGAAGIGYFYYMREAEVTTTAAATPVDISDSVSIPADPGRVPTTEEAEVLARMSVMSFASAVNAGNFSMFYAGISDAWKARTSAADLENAFKEFMEKKMDLTGVSGAAASFTRDPYLADGDRLSLEGYFPTPDYKVKFDLQYAAEEGRWKLTYFGIHAVPVGESGEGYLPDEMEIKRMARQSALLFEKAMAARDFTEFFQNTANLWQRETSPAQLKAIFQSFIDHGVDFTGMGTAEPVLDEEPYMDEDGWLRVRCHFVTPIYKVMAQFKYAYEDEKWKLVAINVNPADKSAEMGGPMPSRAEMEKMVARDLTAFNRAITSGSFESFYQGISNTWKAQISPWTLEDIFQEFIDKKIDLGEWSRRRRFLPSPRAWTKTGG